MDYVLAVSAWKASGGVYAIATLYNNERPIWRDPSEDDPEMKITERNEQI